MGKDKRFALVLGGAIVMVALGALAGILISRSELGASSPTSSTGPRPWHSGGTLHNATLERWRAEDDANRLATCADLITMDMLKQGIHPREIRLDDLKPMAVEMEACITKGGEGTVADDARVGDVAQTCLEGVPGTWRPSMRTAYSRFDSRRTPRREKRK